MAGLPAKFMRLKIPLKQRWARYKASRKSTRTVRTVTRSTSRRSKVRRTEVRHMAKKRKGSYRRMAGRMNPAKAIIPSMLYGAVRAPISNALGGITSKIPLANVGDELVMGAIGWYAAKKGKGILKDVGYGALVVESARVGEAISTGGLNLTNSSSSNNSAGLIVI